VRCWGHSTIVDPWGTPQASSGSGEAVISADLDLGVLTAIREQLPSLANRRPGAYHWPDGPVDAG
jgi:predicted amidohydrolase